MKYTQYVGITVELHIEIADSKTVEYGKLLAEDDNYLIYQAITPDGHWDGLSLIRKSNVNRIRASTAYTDRIEKLILLRKSQGFSDFYCISGNCISDIIKYSIDNHYVISIELLCSCHLDAVGIPLCSFDGYLKLNQLDDDGRANGFQLLKAASITRCYVMSSYEESIFTLHNNQVVNTI